MEAPPARRFVHPRRLGLVLLAGFSFAAAFPPWNLWPLMVLHILAVFQLTELRPRDALGYGWLCGGLSLGLSQTALGLGVISFFELPVVVAAIGFTLAIMIAGATMAAACWLSALARERFGVYWLLPVCFAAAEVVLTVSPGPLPVGVASAHSFPWLLAPADLGSTFVLSLLWFGVVFLGWRSWKTRSLRLALAGLAVLGAWCGYCGLRQSGASAPEVGRLKLLLVQGAYPFRTYTTGFDPDKQAAYQTRLSQAPGDVDVVVWGESSLPYFVDSNIIGFQPRFLPFGPAWRADTSLLACGFEVLPEGGFSPTAWLIDPQGMIEGRSSKRFFVRGGEVFPGQRLFPGLYQSEDTRFPVARSQTASMFIDSLAVAVNICCEDGYPQTSDRVFEEGPGLLINMTNANWFGHWNGQSIHRTAAVLRAVETRLWLVRATNTGWTCVVSPTGEVVAELPQYRRRVLPVEVPVLAGPRGLFGWIGFRAIRAVCGLWLLAVLVAAGWPRIRRSGWPVIPMLLVLLVFPLLGWLEEPPSTSPEALQQLELQKERFGWPD